MKIKGATPFVGRRREQRVLAEFGAEVSEGAGGALVLAGEPGIGKTSLLAQAVANRPDLHIVRITGFESEMGLPFAALHRLLRPWLSRIENLPAPQRDSLQTRFGLTDGKPTDPYLTGLAALTLLTEAGQDRPLLCVIDDAQWLDRESAEALAFVARRVSTECVGLLFAGRSPAAEPNGLTTLIMSGLLDEDADALLSAVCPTPLNPTVAAAIVSGTAGNPRALIDLATTLTPDQLSGITPLPDPLPIGQLLETHFQQRIQALPDATRLLLLLIAATPPQNPTLLWQAAAQLAITPDALHDAQSAGILRTNADFQHPLMRSAVYWGAGASERQQVHAALAAGYDPDSDAEQHARHLAQATIGLDETAAAQLAWAAEQVNAPERAAFLTRAADLSPDPADRAERLVAAAQAHLVLGDPVTATILLDRAEPGLDGPGPRALAQQARADIDLYSERYDAAPALLLKAAQTTDRLDADRARPMRFDALQGILMTDQPELARSLTAPSAGTYVDLFLQGWVARIAGDHESAGPLLRSALSALNTQVAITGLSTAVISLFTADEIWDDVAGRQAWKRLEADQRDAGALGSLRATLLVGSAWELRAGRFMAAEALLTEAGKLQPVTESSYWKDFLAWTGHESAAHPILEMARGRYHQALAALRLSFERDRPTLAHRALPEIVEAGVRSEDHEIAKSALTRMEERALISGTEWALGLLARCRALLAPDDQAETLYQESRDRLARTQIATEAARSHLLYGEWLRRRRRRVDARTELRTALEMFTEMGATAFAERARSELLATGEQTRKRTDETVLDLTPQEKNIARLAAAGYSNGEIAARLFISVSTVEHHLHKVFRKLKISSRRTLASALSGAS